MSKKITNLDEFLENLKSQSEELKLDLTDLEAKIKEMQFNFELQKDDLLAEVSSSLRGFVPSDLGLELPAVKDLKVSDSDIENVLSKIYQV
jgi:hypothetical protein